MIHISIKPAFERNVPFPMSRCTSLKPFFLEKRLIADVTTRISKTYFSLRNVQFPIIEQKKRCHHTEGKKVETIQMKKYCHNQETLRHTDERI